MNPFKVGDTVRCVNTCGIKGNSTNKLIEGATYIVKEITLHQVDVGLGYVFFHERFELINNKIKQHNNMSMLEKFKLLTMGEPQKTFVKAGIADSDGELNTEGKELFTAFLLAKHGDEFKKNVVDKLIEEDKK